MTTYQTDPTPIALREYSARTVMVGSRQPFTLTEGEQIIQTRVETDPRGETWYYFTILTPGGQDGAD